MLSREIEILARMVLAGWLIIFRRRVTKHAHTPPHTLVRSDALTH